MGEIMNGYELLEPFQNKNAGFSRWTYATKEGKTYFLKEFLDPVYPDEESLSGELRKQRIRDCEEFELKKKHLYEDIADSSDGNLITVSEFFRYDSHYYIATEQVLGQKIPMQAMPAVPFENRVLLCKTIAHAMMKLHQAHIVHADIKENNIMLKQTSTAKLVGKIIDFDASFYEEEPPRYEDELGGDQVYLSPEACQFMCGESVNLTCKMDVFALGLLFHQYLTGEMPGFDTAEYDYAFDAVLDEQKLELSEELPLELQLMLQGMFECDPDKRISMDKVFEILYQFGMAMEGTPEEVEEGEQEEIPKSGDWFAPAGDL